MFSFALAAVLVVASPFHHLSDCIFWTLIFLPLLNGDWLQVRGKCHVTDGDTRLGRKEPEDLHAMERNLVTVGKAVLVHDYCLLPLYCSKTQSVRRGH